MSDVVREQILALTATLTQLSSVPLIPGYGIDLVCVEDIDARMTETGLLTNASLSQDLFHRLTTARGFLAADDPDYGIDLRARLSSPQTPDMIRNVEAEIESECSKDPRVQDVVATLTTSGSTWRISIAVTPYGLDSVNGFDLIMIVTSGEAILEAVQNATG